MDTNYPHIEIWIEEGIVRTYAKYRKHLIRYRLDHSVSIGNVWTGSVILN